MINNLINNASIELIVYVLAFFIGLFCLRKYNAGAKCSLNPDLSGKVAVITGGNTGIGYETVKRLSQLGCKVIFGARDEAKNKKAIQQISKTSKVRPIGQKLDLSDRKQIQQFVKEVKRQLKQQKIDYLINNAAIITLPEIKYTAEKIEIQLGVNHFGHFYLTYLLWPLLKKSDHFRIINVSSKAAQVKLKRASLDLENINYQKGGYHSFFAYARSKKANILFTKELQRRIDQNKGNGICLSLHPGTVRSEAVREIVNSPIRRFFYNLITPLLCILMKSPEEGAQTTLYLILERQEKLKKGEYYVECKHKLLKNEDLNDSEKGKKLWELSEQTYGVKFDI